MKAQTEIVKMLIALLSLAVFGLGSLPAAVATVPPPPPSSPRLVTWTMGEVRCSGKIAPVAHLVQPLGAMNWLASVSPVTFHFRIDADGRPVDIDQPEQFVPDYQRDLAPALAVTRFAPGPERKDCTVEYRGSAVPFAEAEPSAVMAFTIFPGAGNIPEVWARIKPVGSTCTAPPPGIRLRAFPDFEKVPEVPGGKDWSMIGYDLDAHGRPVHLKVVARSGNAALDRASLAAVGKSRFAPDARTGCLYPYWRNGPALAAPAEADVAAFRAADANCPKLDWDRKPVLNYPQNYSARSVEGWAIIGFDVAPWGEVGNLRVLAAEPSADFGQAGRNVIQQASLHPSRTGYVGCVEKVRFKMGPRRPLTDVREGAAY